MSQIQSVQCRRLVPLAWVVAVLFSSGEIGAATWTVAADGTGDFTVIQDAVDAASSGDTIEIGPGIYDESTEFHQGGGTIDLCVLIPDGLSLTIVGAGADLTTIGFSDPGTQAGILAGASPSLTVSGCTFLNCSNGGISVGGSGEFEVFHCTFDSGTYGVYHYGDGTAVVRDCKVESQPSGITVREGTVTVESCDFIDGAVKTLFGNDPVVSVVRSSFVGRGVTAHIGTLMLDQCEFEGCEIRVNDPASMTLTACSLIDTELETASSQQLQVSGCTLRGAAIAIKANGSTQILVEDSHVEATGHAVRAYSMSQATVLRSTLTSGSTVVVDDRAATIAINDCELLRQGNGLYYECTPDSDPVTFDFTNNAWGTGDIEVIREHIHDCNYDQNLYPRCIEIDPIAGQTAMEPRSLSGIRSLFR